jgi:3-polyprenyl-4-hydroxybenzoate decarboxylase
MTGASCAMYGGRLREPVHSLGVRTRLVTRSAGVRNVRRALGLDHMPLEALAR